MTLFPPIGSDRASFGYTSRISEGVVPEASVSVLPVNPLESPSFKGGAASYAGGAASGADLTAGATTIDENVLKLRDGANDLVDGILQLRDGADQLSAGLQNEAAPGANKLADGASKLDAGAGALAGGTNDLSAGADKLKTGAGTLSDKLGDAKKGAPDLDQGVADLLAGSKAVDDGLAKLNGLVVPGATQINAGAQGLIDAVNEPLSMSLKSIRDQADTATLLVSGATFADPLDKQKALVAIGTARVTAQGVEDALKSTATPTKEKPKPGFMAVLIGIRDGAGLIKDGVKNTTEEKTPPDADGEGATLKYGTSELVSGLTKFQAGSKPLIDGLPLLSEGADKLADGSGDLSAGAGKLNAGAGTLKDGTGQLAVGAGTLAEGLGTAAEGSGTLADGLDTAAESAPALPEGAETLSEQGTSQLVNVGNATASEFGLKYALIEAGSERAATAQPYGSPEGATELTAYKFEIAGEDGASSANLTRGIAAIALLAAAGGLAAVRRRA